MISHDLINALFDAFRAYAQGMTAQEILADVKAQRGQDWPDYLSKAEFSEEVEPEWNAFPSAKQQAVAWEVCNECVYGMADSMSASSAWG